MPYRANLEEEERIKRRGLALREQLAAGVPVIDPAGGGRAMFDPAAVSQRWAGEERRAAPTAATPTGRVTPTPTAPGFTGGVSGEMPLHTTAELKAMAPMERYEAAFEKEISRGDPWGYGRGVEPPSQEERLKYRMSQMAAAAQVAGIQKAPLDTWARDLALLRSLDEKGAYKVAGGPPEPGQAGQLAAPTKAPGQPWYGVGKPGLTGEGVGGYITDPSLQIPYSAAEEAYGMLSGLPGALTKQKERMKKILEGFRTD